MVRVLNKIKDGINNPTIQTFNNVICDLGSSVNIMLKVTYDNLLYAPLSYTSVYLQLADQTVRYAEGVGTYIHDSRHGG